MLCEINCQKIFFRDQKFYQNYLQILRIEICESITLIDFFLSSKFRFFYIEKLFQK